MQQHLKSPRSSPVSERELLSLLGILHEDEDDLPLIESLLLPAEPPEISESGELYIHDISEYGQVTPENIQNSVMETLTRNGVINMVMNQSAINYINHLLSLWMDENAGYFPVLNTPPPEVYQDPDDPNGIKIRWPESLVPDGGFVTDQKTARR